MIHFHPSRVQVCPQLNINCTERAAFVRRSLTGVGHQLAIRLAKLVEHLAFDFCPLPSQP